LIWANWLSQPVSFLATTNENVGYIGESTMGDPYYDLFATRPNDGALVSYYNAVTIQGEFQNNDSDFISDGSISLFLNYSYDNVEWFIEGISPKYTIYSDNQYYFNLQRTNLSCRYVRFVSETYNLYFYNYSIDLQRI
jgi:hypothetical protein